MIGVSAGEGIGVGSSRIGDRHFVVLELGTSSSIVDEFNVFPFAVFTSGLCALNESNTGISIETFGNRL